MTVSLIAMLMMSVTPQAIAASGSWVAALPRLPVVASERLTTSANLTAPNGVNDAAITRVSWRFTVVPTGVVTHAWLCQAQTCTRLQSTSGQTHRFDGHEATGAFQFRFAYPPNAVLEAGAGDGVVITNGQLIVDYRH